LVLDAAELPELFPFFAVQPSPKPPAAASALRPTWNGKVVSI